MLTQDAIVIAILLQAMYRELPTNLTKGLKKKSKKSKKKNNKSGSGGGSVGGMNSKEPMNYLVNSIVTVGKSLHDLLMQIKKDFQRLLPAASTMNWADIILADLFSGEKVKEEKEKEGEEEEEEKDAAAAKFELGPVATSLLTMPRKTYVAKQLLDDWHSAVVNIIDIIDDRANVLARMPGVA